MLTEYHVQQILNKMDELLEVQRNILERLKFVYTKCDSTPDITAMGLAEFKRQMETIMEEQKETIQDASQSVTITQEPKPEVTTTSENEASKTKESGKTLSKTKSFKNYRAAGGALSWNKWKAAGMPLEP